MTKTRKIAAAAATALAASAAPASAAGAKTYPVGNFTELSVAGGPTVHVHTGARASVTASGPADQLAHLVVEPAGRELKIKPAKSSGWKWWGSEAKIDKVVVNVTVPMLEEAGIAGSGKVDIDRIAGARFKGSVSGSGDLMVKSVTVEDLALSIAGSGDIAAGGAARRAKYSIAGSGDIASGGLKVGDLEVSIAGSGDVRAFATGTALGKIAGSGDIYVTGGAKCTKKVAGSGGLHCS